jgi:hypothetical protein
MMLTRILSLIDPFRLRAAGIHFLISLVIVVAVFVAMLSIWYPSPLFQIIGGWKVLVLIAIVDLTIGPCLTLVAANPIKTRRHLMMDLSVIAVLQLAALAYGLHAMYVGRPVYLIFVKDRMDLVRESEVSDLPKYAARLPQYKEFPKWGVETIGAELPTDPKEINEMTFASFDGVDYQNAPRFYVPYEKTAAKMQKVAAPVSALLPLLKNPDDVAQINKAVAELNAPINDVVVLSVVFDGNANSAFLFVKNEPLRRIHVYLTEDFPEIPRPKVSK